MDAIDLIGECRRHGAVISIEGHGFVVRAQQPLPSDLREALRLKKEEVLACLAACQPECKNALTPHTTHQFHWECDPLSCACYQLYRYPRWCTGAPCRWVWPDGVPGPGRDS